MCFLQTFFVTSDWWEKSIYNVPMCIFVCWKVVLNWNKIIIINKLCVWFLWELKVENMLHFFRLGIIPDIPTIMDISGIFCLICDKLKLFSIRWLLIEFGHYLNFLLPSQLTNNWGYLFPKWKHTYLVFSSWPPSKSSIWATFI